MSDLPPEGPRKQGPILFDLDEQQPPLSPSEAPPVPEPDLPGPQGQAMTTAAALAARQPSKLARWFWALAGTLVSALISIAAWRFAMDLIASVPLTDEIGFALAALAGGAIWWANRRALACPASPSARRCWRWRIPS